MLTEWLCVILIFPLELSSKTGSSQSTPVAAVGESATKGGGDWQNSAVGGWGSTVKTKKTLVG